MTKTTPGVCTNFTRSHAAGQEHGGALAGLTLTLTRCFHGGKLLEARSSNRPPGTKSSASAKSSLHASDQLVWSRVLDPAVRVRDPDPQSSVGLVLNPAVRLRDPDPQSSVEPGLGPGCPGQRPGPTKQCGASLEPGCPGQRPGPTKQCGAGSWTRLSGSETRTHKSVSFLWVQERPEVLASSYRVSEVEVATLPRWFPFGVR